MRENSFEQKKKKPGLSVNQPSNKWAAGLFLCFKALVGDHSESWNKLTLK